jgi:hypothetical protein
MLMNPELETEGIGSLPKDQGPDMSKIPSGELYDATLEAVGQVAPEAVNQYRGAMRSAMSDVEIPPQVVDILIAMFEYLMNHRDQYDQIVSTLVEQGIVPPSMLPDHFDQTYIGTRLAALHELKQDTAERATPMEGMPMAHGGLADVTKYLQSKGREGDTILAHINPEEAALLKAFGGSGTINPETGLQEFKFLPGLTKAISNPIGFVSDGLAKLDDGLHNVVKSPIGRLVATIGLTMVGVPPWLASAGLTAYSGGNLKDVLISGAMGYLGSGGTVMGISPLAELSQFMPGATGSLLNSGLASGTLGMGAGLLQGQSLGQALKSGAMAGAQTAGLQGLGLAAPNAKAAPSDYQTFESLTSPKGYDAGGNNAQQYIDGKLVPGSGLFQDFNTAPQYNSQGQLMSGVEPGPAQTGGIPSPSATAGTPSQFGESPFGVGPRGSSYDYLNGQFARDNVFQPPASTGAAGATAAPGSSMPARPGNFTMTADELAGITRTSGGTPAESSLISRAQDFYNKPSFDNLGKIFVDPSATTTFGKYGPGAALALGATALAGGFKTKPAEKNPAFNPQYTGSNYIQDNPQKFSGSLRAGQFSSNPPTFVPTAISQQGIPMPQVNSPMLPTYSPGPLTNMPGGVPQPYNRPYATGGDVNNYPRKVGPIDGPGTGTSDSIPAMLSDGEFVFTAKAVRNAGGGSRRKGAAKMYKLMKSLENGALGSN